MASLMPICAGLVGPKSENVKISLALACPKWASKRQTHISAANFAGPKKALVRQESEPKEQRSDRSETRSPKDVLSEPLRRRKIDFVGSKCFVSIWELCFLLRQGAHGCKSRETRWPESEKCNPKA